MFETEDGNTYLSHEEVSSEWLRTTPVNRGKVEKLVRAFYKKRAHPGDKVPDVVFLDNPLDIVVLMTRLTEEARVFLGETCKLKINTPTEEEIFLSVRWPAEFQDRLAVQLHELKFSDTNHSWQLRRFASQEYAGAGRSVVRLLTSWLTEWRRWTEYPRGWNYLKGNNLQGLWAYSRRWSYWWSPLRTPLNYGMLMQLPVNKWDELAKDGYVVAKEAFMVLPFEHHALVVDYPTAIHLDENNRLHRINGPALEFKGGAGIWAVNGVMVPRASMDGNGITAAKIANTANVESRRVLIEVYGEERYLLESGSELIDSSEYGELYSRKQRHNEDEGLTMVKVKNSTPEPDGSYKFYFLRVPPQIRSAKGAVAWTFDIPEAQYAPRMET